MTTQTATNNPFANWMLFPFNADEINGWIERTNMMPKVAEYARKAKKGATEFDVVFEDGPVTLRRYRSKVDKKHATPLLCVFALVNRPYVMDLLPHKSVVRQFLNQGFDVYMIDWGVPTWADRNKTLEEYVDGHLHSVVEHLCESTSQDQVSILGYCMGGTLSGMYTSRHQDRVKNLMLMAAPFDWSDRSQLLACWTDDKYFDVDQFVDTVGLVPADYLGTCFKMLKPVDNYISKWIGFYDRMNSEKFLEEFFAMETWTTDNIPIAGETYRSFVKYGLQQNLLVQGEFPYAGGTINLGNITCPVANIVSTADHLVPCGQSLPVKDAISSTDYEEMSVKAGHIGLAVGSRAHRELWPHACSWLAERSAPVS